MTDIQWQTPPPNRAGGNTPSKPSKHQLIASALRDRPGQWALIMPSATASTVTLIKKGRLPAYSPSGSFEAVGRNHEDGRCDIYARFVGEVSS